MESLRSQYLIERRDLMRHKLTPTISRMKQILGVKLSQVLSDQCAEPSKELLGIEPKLKGVTGDLWISPSDLLIGKVCLKPPLTSKHITALTHKGILSIGNDIEMKFWNELEIEKENALKIQECKLQALFDIELRNIGLEVQREEKQKCSKEMKKLERQFEERLQMELQLLEEKLSDTSHITEMLHKQKRNLDKVWQERLEEEITLTVKKMTQTCMEELNKQEKVMLQSFERNLREVEIKKQCAIEEERNNCETIIRRLKHQLECKNIANMMYILCMERRKCKQERDYLMETYENYLNQLNRSIERRDEEIEKLNVEISERDEKLLLREHCLSKILEQYQKFINFALKECPTQAEFLLNVEKFMMYELTDTLMKNKEQPRENQLMKHDKIMQWIKPKAKTSCRLNQASRYLRVQDHHNCFQEEDLPRKLRPETDELPMFYYNGKMYIREDFRNRFSREIKMSPSHHMWNEDVESLMNILKKSIESPHDQCTVESASKTIEKGISHDHHPQPSNVHFSSYSFPRAKASEVKDVSVESIGTQTSTQSPKRKPSMRISENTTLVNFQAIGQEERRKTLLGATNSLELIRRSQCVSAPEEPEETPEATQPYKQVSLQCIEGEVVDLKEQLKKDNYEKRPSADAGIAKKVSLIRDCQLDQISEGSSTVEPEFMSQKESAKEVAADTIGPKVSKLVFTRDSLILAKENTLQKTFDDILETKVAIPKDSITVAKEGPVVGEKGSDAVAIEAPRSCLKLCADSKEMDHSIQEHKPLPLTMSRLSHARDSVELMRDSQKNLHEFTSTTHEESLKGNKSPAIRLSKEELLETAYYETNDDKASSICFRKNPETCDFDLKNLPAFYTTISRQGPIPGLRDNFVNKPNTLRIAGKTGGTETAKNPDEFTTARISSLITLIKDNPELIGMFTSCRT